MDPQVVGNSGGAAPRLPRASLTRKLIHLAMAMLPAAGSMDLWAQSARFNAAESLQLSGLVDDARRIYEELLATTEDAARRSVLNNKIQKLWLNQAVK